MAKKKSTVKGKGYRTNHATWPQIIKDTTNYLTKGGLETNKRTDKAVKGAK